MKVPYFKHVVTDKEIKKSIDVLKSGWLSSGNITQEFEKNFASYVGSKYAVCVTSGTAAIKIALLAAGVKPKDEVITQSFTFIAVVEAILDIGAKPIITDFVTSKSLQKKVLVDLA